MKRAKISLMTALALGGLLACSTLARAQESKDSNAPKQGKRMSIEQRLDRLTEQLKLTDAQKPKIKAVLEDQAKKEQELRADTSLSREQRREKGRALMEDQQKKFKEILTPEQYEKWQKLLEEAKKKRGAPEGEKKSESTK